MPNYGDVLTDMLTPAVTYSPPAEAYEFQALGHRPEDELNALHHHAPYALNKVIALTGPSARLPAGQLKATVDSQLTRQSGTSSACPTPTPWQPSESGHSRHVAYLRALRLPGDGVLPRGGSVPRLRRRLERHSTRTPVLSPWTSS